MRADHALTPVRFVQPRSRRPPSRPVRLWARLRASGLDADLATGIAPWRSPVHAARALQLSGERNRRMLAGSLDRLVKETETPTSRFFRGAVIPPCRAAVSAQIPQIRVLATRLRSKKPVRAEGMARLRLLLCDGTGPVYSRKRSGMLPAALEVIVQSLEVLD